VRLLFPVLRTGAITLLSVELLVRLSGFAEPHLYDPIYMPFAASPGIPYVHKPNLVRARGRGLSIVSTDSLGLRSTEPGRRYAPKGPREYRIAFAGDSVTFGEGVANTEDTYVQVVERMLNERQQGYHVRTFNFGASAYNVAVMAATLRHRMLEVDPDVAVMTVTLDDFNLRRTPEIDPFGYLSDRVPWILARDSPLRKHMRRVHTLYVIRGLVVRYDRAGSATFEAVRRAEKPDSYRFVLEFRDTAVQHGIRCLVVIVPRHDDAAAPLVDHIRRDGIAVLDLSRVWSEFPPDLARAGPFDGHPSAAVHRRMGEEIADAIQGLWHKSHLSPES
jgi:hypothetical protein